MYFILKFSDKHKWHRYAKVKETVVADKKMTLVWDMGKIYNYYR